MTGPSVKMFIVLLLGAVALVSAVIVLVDASNSDTPTCPPGKALVIMPAGKVSVPECV